jgi:hypothetical protein
MSAQVIPLHPGFPNAEVCAVINEAMEDAQRVVEGDPHGNVIPLGKGKFANQIRLLTAAIDVLWGHRDYLRGEKRYSLPRFGLCTISEETQGWWTA